MTAKQFRAFQEILKQVLLYLASAILCMTNIEHHPDVKQRLSPDDLNALKDKHRETTQKYIPPNTLEDFMIVQAMKLRNYWRTQATSMTKKMLEIKSAISQWYLTDLEQDADILKSKVAYNDQQMGTTIANIERVDGL